MFYNFYFTSSLPYAVLPSSFVKGRYTRYAKLYHKLVCPHLAYKQAQSKFIKEVGFFSYNDFLSGGFSDSQRLDMLSDWLKDFRKLHNF